MNNTKNQRFLANSNQHSHLNKRGDITVTILVIGIFVVCSLAMIIFFLTSLKVASNFVDVGLIEKVSSRMEQESPADGIEDRGNIKVPYLKESRIIYPPWYPFFGEPKEVFYVQYYLP